MPQRIAVLTGDVIDSRQVRDRTRLYRLLDDTLAALAARHGGRAERFRGDAFQLALPDPRPAMAVAIALRAALIEHSEAEQRWDARLAVAVGASHWHGERRLTNADDAPFVHSGQGLDTLAEGPARLSLALLDESDDGCLALLVRYLDDLVASWSPYSAEVVRLSLEEARSQQALAEQLGIRQPSVHKRLRVARWPLLADTLAYLGERLANGEDHP
ncbi:adenylate/guanylate cyclase domain-containing protein [Halomonas sp. NO4]|uniref:adenylate/guanylate cyclase domain-containing protein n=1 Tax=Halomonas sp. NO4 TaxID=2484813 RepID=UPI0013D68C43|nr:adenylate/guanylate cyclase domain-containing protein [Halomonas sp. NO4]